MEVVMVLTLHPHVRRLRRCVAAVAALASLALVGYSPDYLQTVSDELQPVSAESLPPDRVPTLLAAMSTEQKVGQLFVVGVNGDAADAVSADNSKAYGAGLDTPAKIVARYNPGGIIYFRGSGNLVNPRQTAEFSNGLQGAATASGAKIALLISTDQEHGSIDRVRAPATVLPGAMALGATYVGAKARGALEVDAAADTRQAAQITSRELRAMGINTDLAPVADVNVNPDNPVIGSRSFSSDPAVASALVSAAVQGFQGSGEPHELASATAKHFPGHGDTNVDSHTGIPVINSSLDEWRRVAAPPFRAAIDAGVDAIMTAHIVMPKLDSSGDPATLSKPILTGLLRGELGFTGVVFTDSLVMKGVRDKYGDDRVPVLALKAGADVLLTPPNFTAAYNGVLTAVRSGEISPQRLDESVTRILRMKDRRGVLDHPVADQAAVDSVVGTKEHTNAAQLISDHSITLLANDTLPTNNDGALPLNAGGKLLVTGWGTTKYPSGRHSTQILADRLAARGVSVQAMATGAEPTQAEITSAVGAARGAKIVVVLTNRTAASDGGDAQQTLISELAATGVRIIAVAADEPYDAGRFTGASAWLTGYGTAEPTLESIAKVLLGESPPVGRLPVAVPGPDGSGAKYPFGHGLSY
ncbi:MAG: glycoside hydrolase family 3 protein [Mycobacteriales bacterium]